MLQDTQTLVYIQVIKPSSDSACMMGSWTQMTKDVILSIQTSDQKSLLCVVLQGMDKLRKEDL